MAQIGPNNPLQPSFYAGPTAGAGAGAGIGAAGQLGYTAGTPSGLNYGGQVMSEVDILVALMKLLQQGQTAPTGGGGGTAATNPALRSAAGKGGQALGQAAGKPGGMGPAQAPALAAAGGKGMALKQAAGKPA